MKFSITIELFFKNLHFIVYIEIFDIIVFVQINVKNYYNEKHQSLFIKVDDYALILLYRKYNILFIAILNSNFN